MRTRIATWWQRLTPLQQWAYAATATVLALALLATAVWAAASERRWLIDEWNQVQPNLVASALWATPAWLYARFHVRRIHRRFDRLHQHLNQHERRQ